MKSTLLPTTTLGKWSTGSIIASFLLFLVFLIMVASGQRGDDTFFSNLTLAIPMMLAGVSGILALVAGVIGIVKSRERSVLVFLATAIGFFALIFLLGEILLPH